MEFLKKFLKGLLIFVLAALLLAAGLRVFVILQGSRRVTTAEQLAAGNEHKSAIIVLGAGVYRDGTLSPMLKCRLDKTVEVYRTGCADEVFVTGDHRPGEYDEVDHMMEYLISQGIPEACIRYDYNGYSTYESIYRARYKYNVDSAVIITQKYHLYRAIFIAESMKMDAAGVDAYYKGSFSGDGYRRLREWAATIKDVTKCILQTEASLEDAS